MQGDADEPMDIDAGGGALPQTAHSAGPRSAVPGRPALRRMPAGYRCVSRASARNAAGQPTIRTHARWHRLTRALRSGVDRYGYYVAVGVCALMVCAGVAVGLTGGGMYGAVRSTPAPTLYPAPELTGDIAAQQTSAGSGLLTGGEPSPEPPARLTVWPLEGELITGHVTDALIYLPTLAMYGTHEGIDIAGAAGQVVIACADGVVAECWREALLGNVVELRCDDGVTLRYAGLMSLEQVTKGARVQAGDAIGAVGTSAMSEAALPPHLHFEVLMDGESVPPLDWLP